MRPLFEGRRVPDPSSGWNRKGCGLSGAAVSHAAFSNALAGKAANFSLGFLGLTRWTGTLSVSIFDWF